MYYIDMMCECGVLYSHSEPMIENAFEINRRLMAVMRLKFKWNKMIFCGLMEILRN